MRPSAVKTPPRNPAKTPAPPAPQPLPSETEGRFPKKQIAVGVGLALTLILVIWWSERSSNDAYPDTTTQTSQPEQQPLNSTVPAE